MTTTIDSSKPSLPKGWYFNRKKEILITYRTPPLCDSTTFIRLIVVLKRVIKIVDNEERRY